MDVSVRDLRNNTAQVIAAVQAGTPVTLTVHGRPVVDTVPHAERQERRPTAVVYSELNSLAGLARQLGVQGTSRAARCPARRRALRELPEATLSSARRSSRSPSLELVQDPEGAAARAR